MKKDILVKYISYNPDTGLLFNNSTGRVMIPDEDAYVYFCKSKPEKIHIKIKANRLCCLIGFGKEIQQGSKVIHKNLNENDYRLVNLLVVTNKDYRTIDEARTNLEGRLRLVPHPEDQLSYFLCWRENGMEKRQLVLDIVTAKRRLLKMQLKYSKILSKFCIFDN